MTAHRNQYRFWTEEKQDRLAQLWSLEGCTLVEIALALDCTPIAAEQQIRVLGLCLTPQAIQARRARGIYRGGWRYMRKAKQHEMPTAS